MSDNWYTATVNAGRDWNSALALHYPNTMPWKHEQDREIATRLLTDARAWYRRRVLLAFWKFIAPIGPGQCVPNEVAKLLAEQWDEETKPC